MVARVAGRGIGELIGRIVGRTGTAVAGEVLGAGARVAGRGANALGRAAERVGLGELGPGVATGRSGSILSLVRRGGIIAGGGAAFELGTRALPGGSSFPGGDIQIEPGTGLPSYGGGGAGAAAVSGGDFPQPGQGFGTSYIVRTWTTNPNTGFPFFMKLADGRIVVTRRDGTLKSYRPSKPIVFSRKPTVRQLVRAQKVMNRYRNQVKKEFHLKER